MWSRYAFVPMFIWMPNSAAGPERAADWPSTMALDVTPGACACAEPASVTASAVRVVSRTRAMSVHRGDLIRELLYVYAGVQQGLLAGCGYLQDCDCYCGPQQLSRSRR